MDTLPKLMHLNYAHMCAFVCGRPRTSLANLRDVWFRRPSGNFTWLASRFLTKASEGLMRFVRCSSRLRPSWIVWHSSLSSPHLHTPDEPWRLVTLSSRPRCSCWHLFQCLHLLRWPRQQLVLFLRQLYFVQVTDSSSVNPPFPLESVYMFSIPSSPSAFLHWLMSPLPSHPAVQIPPSSDVTPTDQYLH